MIAAIFYVHKFRTILGSLLSILQNDLQVCVRADDWQIVLWYLGMSCIILSIRKQ